MLVNAKFLLAAAFLASTTLVQAFPAPALDVRQSWDFQQFGAANPEADPDAPGGGLICIGSRCPPSPSTTSTISTTMTTTTTTASVMTTGGTTNGPANNGTTTDASNDGTGGNGGEPGGGHKGTYYKPPTYGAEP
ncbi:hypothetical protein P691DRAFT_774265 [Macrolepiota fuliginosa MF-IS2]|uniref:Uncharacterized protein n=1 Tax=Macrolepiota fuliginosa MF-IS2 TaxID=1400762 RepID=A0A9P5XHP9_9AGAR|nr:hypothetical protein P691DRAFT_774265 [Macrolepiota fuliginosa MF-IS2]